MLLNNYEITKADLDYHVREKSCILPNGMDKDINISAEVEKTFEKLAVKITRKVTNLIKSAPPMVQKRIAKIAFTGGGSLAKVNDGEELHEKIASSLNMKASISSSPLTDNMEGGMKVYLSTIEQNAIEDEIIYAKGK